MNKNLLPDTDPTSHQEPKWKTWQGQNRFFCNGRTMMGKGDNKWLVAGIYSGMLVGLGYFFTIVGHPNWHFYGPTLSILVALSGISLLICVLRTTFADPGVIPRGNLENLSEEQIIYEAKKAGYNIDENTTTVSPDSQPTTIVDKQQTSSDTEVNDASRDYKQFKLQLYTARHCYTCKIMRPPKASHCYSCDNCVKEFDHHCTFLGNCVGIRNKKFFVGSMTAGALTIDLTLITALINTAKMLHDNAKLSASYADQYIYYLITGGLLISLLFKRRERLNVIILSCAIISLCVGFGASIKITGKVLENPIYNLLYIIGMIPIWVWIHVLTFYHLAGISKELTMKEDMAIKKQAKLEGVGIRYDLGCMDRMRNIFKFFWDDVPPSEVLSH